MIYNNINFFIFYICLTIWFLNSKIVEGIIGGFNAHVNQFKYQVSVQANKHHICGGVIISDLHVLTAAHCVIDEIDRFRKETYSIVGGVIDVNNKKLPRIKINVEKIFVPKEFIRFNPNPNITEYHDIGDVAVLKLASSLSLNSNPMIKKVNLPQISHTLKNYVYSKPTIAGFGADVIDAFLNTNGEIEVNILNKKCSQLKYAETTVITNAECQPLFLAPIHEEHICAQIKQNSPQRPEGVCYGDSGSPLVLPDFTVIGILSRCSIHCNEQNHAAIYTRLTSYLQFIWTAMQDQNSNSIRVAIYKKKNILVGKVLTEIKTTDQNN